MTLNKYMKPTKDELMHNIAQFTIKDLSAMYEVSDRTVARWIKAYGLNTRAKKLNIAIAKEVRLLYFQGNKTQSEIAKMYGVTTSCIGRIVNNDTYKVHPIFTLGGEAEVKAKYRYDQA